MVFSLRSFDCAVVVDKDECVGVLRVCVALGALVSGTEIA